MALAPLETAKDSRSSVGEAIILNLSLTDREERGQLRLSAGLSLEARGPGNTTRAVPSVTVA